MGGRKGKGILRVITNKNPSEKEPDYNDFGLFEKEKRVSSDFFLNYYTTKDIIKLLEECAIIKLLRDKHNFNNLYIKINIDEYDQHSLTIYDESCDNIPLVLLRLREVYFDAFKHFISGIRIVNVPMLMIDWITLQNPKKQFSDERKKMPGQNYPGLNMLKQFYKFTLRLAKDLSVKALLAVPEYFHLAFIYSPVMKFYDPELQGKFTSIVNDLHFKENKQDKRQSVTECSFLIEQGKLFNYIKNEKEYWHPGEMIVPLEKKGDLYKYFNSPIYQELENSYSESNRYRFLQ